MAKAISTADSAPRPDPILPMITLARPNGHDGFARLCRRIFTRTRTRIAV